MTLLEQILAARELSFLQFFVSGKVVGVSLFDGGNEVARFEKGSVREALEAMELWLARRLEERAVEIFWEWGANGIDGPTPGDLAATGGRKVAKTPAERQKAYRERRKETRKRALE